MTRRLYTWVLVIPVCILISIIVIAKAVLELTSIVLVKVLKTRHRWNA